jgi:endogenous inhibitor of DNA gyrase (YacG/DUF329 family)
VKKRAQRPATDPAGDLFDSLVRNAIDFLQKSVQELEKHPKYSVIHFYMSLELFLKARLLREHWSLVVSKVEKASLQAFRSGDFNSVTIDECLQRLGGIADVTLLTHEQECFRTIRDHRNKLVHFFHPKYQEPIDKQVLAQVVSEQCKAWVYLHRLLTSKWKGHFTKYGKQIAGLQKLLRRNQHFLSSKFKALAPEIDAAKKQKIAFVPCASCGFESAQITLIHKPLFLQKCLVCDLRSHFLLVPCPDCGQPVTIESEEGGLCEACEATINFDYLVAHLGPYEDPKEESSIAHCCYCESYEPTVIPFTETQHLCLNCFELHNEVGQCGWCGELITGDTAFTSVTGCFHCPGPDLKD